MCLHGICTHARGWASNRRVAGVKKNNNETGISQWEQRRCSGTADEKQAAAQQREESGDAEAMLQMAASKCGMPPTLVALEASSVPGIPAMLRDWLTSSRREETEVVTLT